MSQTIGQTRLAYARAWHRVDLSSDTRPLGRLATQIALVLMGKHKPIFDPSTDCGDYVVALNCRDVRVTGRKRAHKVYRSHTTRPGSLREITLERLVGQWGGGEVLRRAVRGMLPKNRLREGRLGRLKCFEGANTPYGRNVLRVRGVAGAPEVRRAFGEERAKAGGRAER